MPGSGASCELDGLPCGCGNRGCLETVESDTSITRVLSDRVNRKVNIEEVVEMIRQRDPIVRHLWEKTCRYLGVALATVINTFNPSDLFVHGRLLECVDEPSPRPHSHTPIHPHCFQRNPLNVLRKIYHRR